ncbi:hypothetical protein MASR2M69_00360 [Bacteroidota bacterium]
MLRPETTENGAILKSHMSKRKKLLGGFLWKVNHHHGATAVLVNSGQDQDDHHIGEIELNMNEELKDNVQVAVGIGLKKTQKALVVVGKCGVY